MPSFLTNTLLKNREYVKKSYNKAKMYKRAQERKNTFKNITFYMINGTLTTERPERDL